MPRKHKVTIRLTIVSDEERSEARVRRAASTLVKYGTIVDAFGEIGLSIRSTKVESTEAKVSALALTRQLRRTERDRDALQVKLDAAPDFDSIMSAARRWHYSEVRSIVEDALDRVRRERSKSPMTANEAREWLQTDVDQTTDGHGHVIYTGQAVMLLAASDNDGAYESDDGTPTGDTSVRACAALRADVWQLLEARSDEWERDDEDEPDDEEGAA